MSWFAKKATKGKVAAIMSVIMTLSVIITASIATAKASVNAVVFNLTGGYFESAYAKWGDVSGVDGYVAYVKKDSQDDNEYKRIDNELIRKYKDGWRVDALGLPAGNYNLKVVPVVADKEIEEKAAKTGAIKVDAYDRSGFAFSKDSKYKTASGAYNDDGSLKSDAIVLYVYDDTAKTVTADITVDKKGKKTTFTGLQSIIDAYQKGCETRPLDIRIIGNITADTIDHFSSKEEGIQIKGKNAYSELGITIEGVGEDASVSGFGFLLRNAANVEMRNFSILNFMDDGISLDTENANVWLHNLDLYYGQAGSDSDQAKGDGSIDIKGNSQFVTVSYVHFYDSGKCSLCGMKSESGPNYITYHHNWFDHADSRMARIRTMSVHLYDNYYDGNSKYGVGVTTGSSAFVENNYFRGVNHPMLSSKQGTDGKDPKGTFSGENGGIIKAFNNIMVDSGNVIYANTENGNSTDFDAYLASDRNEVVASSYKTVQGNTSYDNFDTSKDLGVDPQKIDDASVVPSIVTAYAGSQGGGVIEHTFSEADDVSYTIDKELKALVTAYANTELVSVKGTSSSTTVPTQEETTTAIDETKPQETSTQKSTEATTKASEETTAVSDVEYIQNFTTDGLNSNFYSITGNLAKDKGSVTYNGLTLTTCLKIESSTSIKFKAPADGKLTLVSGDANNKDKKIKVNGQKISSKGNIFTIDIKKGDVEITKGDSLNIYYMAFVTGEEIETSSKEDETIKPEETTKQEETTKAEETTKETKTESSTEAQTQADHSQKEVIPYDEYNKANTTYSGAYTSLAVAKDSDFTDAIYVDSSEKIIEAIKTVKPGQAIIVKPGRYKFDETVLIEESNSGLKGSMKILRASNDGEVIFDFSSMEELGSNRGVVLDADYWYVNGIRFYGAGDNGMLLSGSHNIIEGCIFEANHDTGLQLSRYNTSYASPDLWPSNNLILNCTSFDNMDVKTQENADGFAAKLTCGEGNVFDGCISYCNSDDGWDLFAKPATGPIGKVTIRNCVAFNNGKTTAGTSFGSGDMNGFKLGGSGVGTAHTVFNCLAFNNGATGFTDNNNPSDLSLVNCTAAANGNAGKGKGNFICYRSASNATYRNLISYDNAKKQSDKFNGVMANSTYFTNNKYYSINSSIGTALKNNEKVGDVVTLENSDFKNTDNKIDVTADINKLLRTSTGTVNVNGLYESVGDISTRGARFNVASQMLTINNTIADEEEKETKAEPETKSETNTQTQSETNTQTQPETQSETNTQAQPESTTEATKEVAADEDIVYEMLEGNNVNITNDKDLVLRSAADYSLFVGVKVDGAFISKNTYKSYSGSTVVVIPASFLKTLTAGYHEFVIVSKNGSATANVKLSERKAEVAGDEDVVTLPFTDEGEVAADTDLVVAADTDLVASAAADAVADAYAAKVSAAKSAADKVSTTSTEESSNTGDRNGLVIYVIFCLIALMVAVDRVYKKQY